MLIISVIMLIEISYYAHVMRNARKTEFEGHLNHIYNYKIPVHVTNLTLDMANVDM